MGRRQRERRAGGPRAAARRGAGRRSADHRLGQGAEEVRPRGRHGRTPGPGFLDLLLGKDSRARQDGAGPTGGPAAGAAPGGFAGRVTLTVPLANVTRLADRPGEISGIGPVDPWLARDLANAAAADPKTMWCITVTDGQGHAVGHGCARPEPKSHRKRARDGPGFSFTATDDPST